MRLTYLATALAMLVFSCAELSAQTTAFNYQGSLQSSGAPANGNFDFQFALFDAVSGGSQLGSTISSNAVTVTNGVFSVSLDFGSQFPGANRFLEVRVRQTGGAAFTTLSPRQQVTSSPYSIKTLSADTATDATQLGGVAAGQYVVTSDPRMTDARPPAAGSSNYIQNQNVGIQATGNFKISGAGAAASFNAGQFNDAQGRRILKTDDLTPATSNTFVGLNSGNSNIPGSYNTFVGTSAGSSNVGQLNSFFGTGSGQSNVGGDSNSFFGFHAGSSNTSGSNNAFFGGGAGNNNSGGSFNTVVGVIANVSSGNLQNATAIGYCARVSQNNSMVLGSFAGNGCSADFDTSVGIGTAAPAKLFHIRSQSTADTAIQIENTTSTAGASMYLSNYGSTGAGNYWSGLNSANTGSLYSPGSLVLRSNHAIRFSGSAAAEHMTIDESGNVRVYFGLFLPGTLGGGTTQLCLNASNAVSTCSSSLRYKKNIGGYRSGIELIDKLRPITFDWKDGGMHDLGLGAEDVAKVDPLLVTYNKDGQVEGVKYDRIGVVLINAVKEQQAQIELQKKQIEEQRSEVEALKKLVCKRNRKAAVCKTR